MIPSIQQAETYLREGFWQNQGLWADHSRYVGQAARLIAERVPGLDPDRAQVLGMLHDIGRRFGITGNLHIIDGYDFMMRQGFPDVARICLTHSFPLQDIESCFGSWQPRKSLKRDGEAEKQRVAELLSGITYDEYDRLIQLCDALATSKGFCLMEKRWVNVVMRYGPNPYMVPKWKATYKIKEHFEKQMGVSVYEILPGVKENTFA
ncbi:MAG TPA: HD domain-containing protein [Firmicutes bacterium]|nr:HD domain-containing protein [Bacillota bacterium]